MAKDEPVEHMKETNGNEPSTASKLPLPQSPLPYRYIETHEDTIPAVTQQSPAAAGHGSSTIISFPEVIENSDTSTLVKNMEFSDKTIRLGFIRKVYFIVLVQLVITGVIIFGFMQYPNITMYARRSRVHFWFLMFVPMCVYFSTYLCILCCEGPRRKVPYNYIFLLLFTISLGMMVGIVAPLYQFKEIFLAAGTTFAIVLALTIFAFQTKLDFTTLYASCLCLLLALIFLGIAMLATSYDRLRLVYSALGIVFISIYIVMDTQMIIGGEHRYSISPEEYVFAALVLYVDTMYLFMRLLRIYR